MTKLGKLIVNQRRRIKCVAGNLITDLQLISAYGSEPCALTLSARTLKGAKIFTDWRIGEIDPYTIGDLDSSAIGVVDSTWNEIA